MYDDDVSIRRVALDFALKHDENRGLSHDTLIIIAEKFYNFLIEKRA